MSTHYTITQMYALRPQFQAMLEKLILSITSNLQPQGTAKHQSMNIDGALFCWRTEFHGEIGSNPAIATSYLKIGSGDFTVSYELGDFIEFEIPQGFLDKLTDMFMSNIAVNMARSWYSREGMQERITNLAEEQDFDGIRNHLEIELEMGYSDNGYVVTVFDAEGSLLVKDEHTSATPDKRDPSNTNFHIFLRYLENGVVLLLSSENIWKNNWSAPLI